VAAFFAASPFLLVEPATAMRDVIANRAIVVDRATEAGGPFGSLAFYLRWLLRDAMGVTTVVLAGLGAVMVGLSGWRKLAIVLMFPSVFLLFIANTYPASRYLNPVLPFLALLAGAACTSLRRLPRSGVLLASVAVAAAGAEGAIGSIRTDRFFRETDTRTQALAWIEQHVPAGASVLIQPYSVPLRVSREALAEGLTANLGSVDRASVRFRRQLELDPYPSPAYRTIFLGDGGLDAEKIYVSPSAFSSGSGFEPLDRLGIDWVVMKQYNVADPAVAPVEKALTAGGSLAASFSPYRADLPAEARRHVPPFLHNTDTRIDPALERPGPIVQIWRIE
jgi:hypothetical protein